MGAIRRDIDAFLKKGYTRFFMPGHKGKTGYPRDLTEVDTLDDLHNPKGAIRSANMRLADVYAMDYATMSTGGSTCCVMAMLISVDGKILIGRDAHKSAINTASLFNLECEFFKDTSTEGYLAAIESTDAKVLYITYPAYDSTPMDVGEVVKAAKQKGMAVIADCAHGAHFPFSHRLPQLPSADMFCVSLHKTMGSLTGGAAVFSTEDYARRLKDNFSRIHSTSPSFLIMESVDSAVDYMLENPLDVEHWINECERVKGLLTERVQVKPTEDVTRIVLSASGYTGYELSDIYRRHGLMAEMADLRQVIFITSPYDTVSIKKLANVRVPKSERSLTIPRIAFGEEGICMAAARKLKPITKRLEDCSGWIAYQPLGAYPPGQAAVLPGEVITDDVIEYFQAVLLQGGNIYNMENEEIQVVKP